MTESSGTRRFWRNARRAGVAIVPIAFAIAVPLLPAQAAVDARVVPAAVQSLTKIMHPVGHPPVGTRCIKAPLYGMRGSTVRARIFCDKTTAKHIVVWGYQFKSHTAYLAGVRHMNSFTGFSGVIPDTACPPGHGKAGGLVGWHALHNRKYRARKGQFLECFHVRKHAMLIWTMPTQNVFFMAQDKVKGSTIAKIIHWWDTVSYSN
jgi:hypothetical protein